MDSDSNRAIGDLTIIVHALLRRLGADDVTLTADEIYRAAEDAERRELVFTEETADRLRWGTVRVWSALRFSSPPR